MSRHKDSRDSRDSSEKPAGTPARPTAIVLEGPAAAGTGNNTADTPAPGPKTLPVNRVREESEDPFTRPVQTAQDMAEATTTQAAPPFRTSLWLRLLLSSLAGLVLLWMAQGFWHWIQARMIEGTPFSWLLLALAVLATLSAFALVLRETLALSRLARITRLHHQAETALAENDETAMKAVAEALTTLYARRPDMRWSLSRLQEMDEAMLSSAEWLAVAERELMAPLDAAARRAIVVTARRIAVLTAMIPVPALDVGIVGLQTLRLVRTLATLYGARPGWLGGWRLLRMSIAHLAIAGAMALSDTVLQTVLGKGLVGRLSARFGEGAVNALLAVRIGLAAMEIVRPLPFRTLEKPSFATMVRAALAPGRETDPTASDEKG